MKTLIVIIMLSTTNLFAHDLFLPLQRSDGNCSTNEITKILPKEMTPRVNTIHLAINKIAYKLEVNPCLILSIVWVESTFKHAQTSNKGAKGLMQVMPRTKEAMSLKMGLKLNRLYTANLDSGLSHKELENLIIGTYYFKTLLKQFEGNTKHAIVAYNKGPTRVAIDLAMGYKFTANLYLNKVNKHLKIVTINNWHDAVVVIYLSKESIWLYYLLDITSW